jgi:pimeloyl-ACP methyl ester carboxylesterase
VPRDDTVISEKDLSIYAAAMTRNGFFGADSYYMNHGANAAYAKTAMNGGRLEMPVLFLAARYDYTCESIDSDLAKAMPDLCPNLTTRIIDSGHWMAQEKPAEVNAALTHWLAMQVAEAWPGA